MTMLGNRTRYSQWREQRDEELRLRRAATRPPIAAALPVKLDVAAIRLALPGTPFPVTQDQFARRFGFSPGAVQDWEQGRRKPEGASRVLLAMIQHDPETIETAIQSAIGHGLVFEKALIADEE